MYANNWYIHTFTHTDIYINAEDENHESNRLHKIEIQGILSKLLIKQTTFKVLPKLINR